MLHLLPLCFALFMLLHLCGVEYFLKQGWEGQLCLYRYCQALPIDSAQEKRQGTNFCHIFSANRIHQRARPDHSKLVKTILLEC